MKKQKNGFRRLSHRGLAISAALLLILSTFSILASTVHAAYTYTVRVYAGVQGTFNKDAFKNVLVDSKNVAVNLDAIGASMSVKDEEVVITGIPGSDSYGKPYRVVYTPNMVKVSSDKYLVRGLRESGKDNETINKANFDVSRDMDIVVGYYIANGVVAYTVNYVDEDGQPIFTELADGTKVSSETHYGNAGEDVVLAFPYIEDYQPRAYNGILPLDADAAKNVFNFPYQKIERQQGTTTVIVQTTESTSAGGEGTETTSGGEGESQGGQGESQTGGENESSGGAENESSGGGQGESSGGGQNESSGGGQGESQGGQNESSGSNETSSAQESASQNESTNAPETSSSEIEETMDFSSTEGPAGSTDFTESESEGEDKELLQRILDVIKHPGFIFGSLGFITAIVLLIIFLVNNKKNKSGRMNVEEKDD